MSDIIKLLTLKRLNKYHINKEKSFKYHMYNIELSETFYPVISCFEIVLRNKIDQVFSKHLGANWLLNEKYPFHTTVDIKSAQSKLKTQRKNHTDKDYIISELNFGFWTSLFKSSYNNIIWNNTIILSDIFNKSKITLRLDKKRTNLNKIRMYRNKIFHYSSIIEGAISPKRMHDMLYSNFDELDAGILLKEIKKLDRFNTVYQKGVNEHILQRK